MILIMVNVTKQTYKIEDNEVGMPHLHFKIQEGLSPWLMNLGFFEIPLRDVHEISASVEFSEWGPHKNQRMTVDLEREEVSLFLHILPPGFTAVHSFMSSLWEECLACSRCSMNVGQIKESFKSARFSASLFLFELIRAKLEVKRQIKLLEL